MKIFGGIVAVLLTVTGCGSLHSPAARPSPERGTIAGRVLAYPCAPVERIGSPCAGRPVSGDVLTIDPLSGDAAAHATTGADGGYRVTVAPGRYRVTVGGRPIGGASRVVDVVAGEVVIADFTVDSGIR